MLVTGVLEGGDILSPRRSQYWVGKGELGGRQTLLMVQFNVNTLSVPSWKPSLLCANDFSGS